MHGDAHVSEARQPLLTHAAATRRSDVSLANADILAIQSQRVRMQSSEPNARRRGEFPIVTRYFAGRLLLTWTHRSNLIDDDGYGTGSRGLLSGDDGLSWDFDSDYIIIKAQDDGSVQAVSSGCAPSTGGCGCGVGCESCLPYICAAWEEAV